MAWLTSRIERRTLLISTLAVSPSPMPRPLSRRITHAAGAPPVDAAVGALYTPQAAGTAGLIAREESAAAPSPTSFSAGRWPPRSVCRDHLHRQPYGFRAAYGGIGLIACVSFVLLAWRLPADCWVEPVDLKTGSTSDATG